MNEPAKPSLFQFSLWQTLGAVTILSVLCAIVPGAALVIVGTMPVALGFVCFVIADQKDSEGFRLLGAVLMALGLFAGAFAMLAVSGSGG